MQAMLLAFYGAQVVFFLCYIYLYRLLYRNVSRLLVNNACMLLCVGFIMLTRLSMAKGLDKALRQFAIVVISAALAWLVPYIMERVWQLYKLPVGICGGRAPDSSCGMGFRKRELRRPVVPYHSRSIHPAVGICEADLCVFCGVHVLSVHGFQNHFPDNGRGGAHVLVLVLSRTWEAP